MNRHLGRTWALEAGGKPLAVTLAIVKVLLIVVAALMGIYLIGVNTLLNIEPGRRLMNSHPQDVRIAYKRAWSIWPGCVHVTGADISGQDSQNQFAVTAERAQITLTTAGIRTKDVTGTHLRGEEVTIRIRRRVLKMPSDKEMAKLPEIKYFPSPLKEDAPDQRVIGVRLEDVKAQHVREIWVDGFRVLGDIDAEGGMYYKPRREVEVYPTTVQIATAAMTTGEDKVLSQLHGIIELLVDTIDLQELSIESLKKVAMATDLHLNIDSVRFLNDLLGRQDVTLKDGAGKLDLAVKLERGTLADGSQVQLAIPRLQATLPYVHAQTGVELALKADGAKKYATFSLQLGSLALTPRGSKAVIRSKSIRVHGHTGDLDLTHTPTAELRADLPGITAGELGFINAYIPSGTTFGIEGGSATLSGHVDVSTAKNKLDGVLDLEGTDVAMKNGSARLRGGVRVHGMINSFGLKSQSADLKGTWLALQDVAITYGGKQTDHWEGRVDLSQLTLHPQGKRKVDAVMQVFLKNLQPLVGIIAESVKVPSIAQALANRDNVVTHTRIQMSDTTLAIPQLEVNSPGFEVKGQALVTDLQKKEQHKDAFILIKLGPLPIGIDVHDKTVKPILINPQRWFDERLTASTLADSKSPR